jgi:hypothetical protein
MKIPWEKAKPTSWTEVGLYGAIGLCVLCNLAIILLAGFCVVWSITH